MRSLNWYVVCHPPDTPDGPAKFIGPFPKRDWAEFDLWMQPKISLAGDACTNAHYVGTGPEDLTTAKPGCDPRNYPKEWEEFSGGFLP